MATGLHACIDRVIPVALRGEAARVARLENPSNAPAAGLEMALETKKLWKPGRTLRIRFLEGSPKVQARVEAFAREWLKYANIKFEFIKSGDAEVRIAFKDDGSWSAVGTDSLVTSFFKKDEATMNYGWLTEQSTDDDAQRLTRLTLDMFRSPPMTPLHIETQVVLTRLDEALELIERTQPWRLAHMRRDLSHFKVIRYACRGAFFPDERACMTELTFLARTDITAAPVASSILHEGVHARVHAMGLRPESKDMAREERLCRRAELSFGLALPPELGAPVVERARASLELEDQEVAPVVDWSEAQRRIDAVDQAARNR